MKPGDVVAGKYRVVRVLAQKRGFLLEGRHTEFDQHVVIRLLAPGMCDRKEVERFRREARTLSKLESEHAARIIDVGTHSDGSFFLVRQYLDGDDLGSYIQKRGALRLDEAILYVLQACEAIQEAHSHNIIVRELSPSHLFLTKRRGGSALVKITDFGTAKVLKDTGPSVDGQSEMTAIFGISPYASPELVRKTGDIDHRTDVWSLGCVFYELLAATPPFSGDMAELMIKITREAHIPISRMRADVPKQLDQIIDWALAKDPASRFGSVYAF
ncbi:MAG: serine/threonine-protein kinase, partial [Polyangiaceae bacterium]